MRREKISKNIRKRISENVQEARNKITMCEPMLSGSDFKLINYLNDYYKYDIFKNKNINNYNR